MSDYWSPEARAARRKKNVERSQEFARRLAAATEREERGVTCYAQPLCNDGFDDAYIDAMSSAEKAKCPTCGKSLLAHAARFVSEACGR